ncbi:MAG: hypothetical protein V8R80_07420 [Eubacterium sp.]
MDRKELEAQVLELVAACYKKDVSTLSMDTTFKEDLGRRIRTDGSFSI